MELLTVNEKHKCEELLFGMSFRCYPGAMRLELIFIG